MKKTKVKKQKTLKKQGCSLFLLLMLLALAPVVLATVILSTTSLRLTRTNLEGSVQTTLHVTADNLAKYCKENEITAINASGYYEYLDSLKEEGLEMAILADVNSLSISSIWRMYMVFSIQAFPSELP